jgi:RNA polymerase sigma-70 factor (ECF subfamily)
MPFDSNFEQFYRKYQPSLVAYAIYLTKSKEDAIEIVNDVFVAIWNKKDNLQIGDGLKAYLYTATKNRCFNFLKQRKIEFSQLQDLDVESDLKADQILSTKEQVKSINDVLAMLPPRCKQVFLMSRIDGFTYKEIAELLEISIKTVENQMSKALKIFKEKLKIE